jgi:hypothetical protein
MEQLPMQKLRWGRDYLAKEYGDNYNLNGGTSTYIDINFDLCIVVAAVAILLVCIVVAAVAILLVCRERECCLLVLNLVSSTLPWQLVAIL